MHRLNFFFTADLSLPATWPQEHFLTRVYPDANGKTLSGHVADSEDLDGAQEVQSHGGDFPSVLITVADGYAAGHHVCIADGLHLVKMTKVRG